MVLLASEGTGAGANTAVLPIELVTNRSPSARTQTSIAAEGGVGQEMATDVLVMSVPEIE